MLWRRATRARAGRWGGAAGAAAVFGAAGRAADLDEAALAATTVSPIPLAEEGAARVGQVAVLAAALGVGILAGPVLVADLAPAAPAAGLARVALALAWADLKTT